jgi:thymidylate kinase
MPIVALDGTDGVGKSLICTLLHDHLHIDLKKKVSLYQMPGSTEIGQELRRLVKSKKYPLSPVAERLLFSVDTVQFFKEKLANRTPDEIVLMDRWSPITDLAYGLANGLPLDFMTDLQRIAGVVGGPDSAICDLYIILQVPIEILEERRAGKEIRTPHPWPDRIEAKGKEFMVRVGDAFNSLLSRSDLLLKKRAKHVAVVDANRPAKEVMVTVLGLMNQHELL